MDVLYAFIAKNNVLVYKEVYDQDMFLVMTCLVTGPNLEIITCFSQTDEYTISNKIMSVTVHIDVHVRTSLVEI